MQVRKFIRNQDASVSTIVALSFFALAAVVALAIEAGHIFYGRAGVQDIADASALRGADILYHLQDPTQFTATYSGTGFSGTAQQAASSVATTDGATVAAVYVGPWNAAPNPGPDASPSVQITVQKASHVYLAHLVGSPESVQTQASATAIIRSPYSVSTNNMLPIALNQCAMSGIGTTFPVPNGGSQWNNNQGNCQQAFFLHNDMPGIMSVGNTLRIRNNANPNISSGQYYLVPVVTQQSQNNNYGMNGGFARTSLVVADGGGNGNMVQVSGFACVYASQQQQSTTLQVSTFGQAQAAGSSGCNTGGISSAFPGAAVFGLYAVPVLAN